MKSAVVRLTQHNITEKEDRIDRKEVTIAEESQLREYILYVMNKVTSWKFVSDDETEFFDHILSFSTHLEKYDIISSEDVELLLVRNPPPNAIYIS